MPATSKGSDQTAHMCSLVRAFAGHIYHIVGNFILRLNLTKELYLWKMTISTFCYYSSVKFQGKKNLGATT